MAKDFWFPCLVRHILSSQTILLMTGDAFKAYWILLNQSWLQRPRASLPNSQADLQALARVSDKQWATIKDEVMACFYLGKDGRLYNETLLGLSTQQENKSRAGSKGGSKTQADRKAKRVAKPQASESESESESEVRVILKKEAAALFNEICTSLPKIQAIGKTRGEHLGVRIKAHPDEQFWIDYFTQVEASDFLSGRNGDWQHCGFDWLILESNMNKVLEGNYTNKPGRSLDDRLGDLEK